MHAPLPCPALLTQPPHKHHPTPHITQQVSSTETGHIFGTIVYENSSTAEKTYVNLNDIQMDIMDYIRPASCSDEAFRAMWAEFEWENKVRAMCDVGVACVLGCTHTHAHAHVTTTHTPLASTHSIPPPNHSQNTPQHPTNNEQHHQVAINTTFTDLQAFLAHVVASTNMRCLTPTSSLSGKSSFLAANLYAKSVFGEDALVNLSVEKKDDADGKLSGYVRIRSKTQGIALSLGDRITAVQRVATAAGGPPDM